MKIKITSAGTKIKDTTMDVNTLDDIFKIIDKYGYDVIVHKADKQDDFDCNEIMIYDYYVE